MKKLIFACLLLLVLPTLAACTFGDTPTETVSPTQSPPTQPPPPPPPTEPPDRCSLYEGLDFSIVVYSIYPGDTTVTTYSKFPGTVVGYGDDAFEYYAMLGDEESLDCMIFEGETYKERVYCMFKITKEDYGSARHYKLMVKGCDEVIHDVPLLSLMVEGDEASSSGGSGGGSSGSASCGAPPESLCSSKYEDWCNCMGGNYICVQPSVSQAACWMP